MYRIARVAAIAASAFVLSACASNGTAPAPTVTPSPTASATVAPAAVASDESTEMAACAVGAAEVSGTCAWDAVSAEAILTPPAHRAAVTHKVVVTPKPASGLVGGAVTNRLPGAPTGTLGGVSSTPGGPVSKTIDPNVPDGGTPIVGVVPATPRGTAPAPDVNASAVVIGQLDK